MTLQRCVLVLALVLFSAGCIKTGGGETTTTSTSSTTSSTSTSTSVSTSLVTTSVMATTVVSTTLKPETTYTTIFRGTCFDGIQNQGEQGTDCGGPCRSCDIECSGAGDCGQPHYGRQYCSKVNETAPWRAMRDYVTYDCLSPGEWNASCRLVKKPEVLKTCRYDKVCVFTDFCPSETYKSCEEARCVLKDEACGWLASDELCAATLEATG